MNAGKGIVPVYEAYALRQLCLEMANEFEHSCAIWALVVAVFNESVRRALRALNMIPGVDRCQSGV